MVNKENRDRLIEKLEEILDLGGEDTADLLDRLFDILLSDLILLHLENDG